jgi:hypothetical protein
LITVHVSNAAVRKFNAVGHGPLLDKPPGSSLATTGEIEDQNVDLLLDKPF